MKKKGKKFQARYLSQRVPLSLSHFARVKYSMFPSWKRGACVVNMPRVLVSLRDRIPPNLRSRR